MHSTTQALNKYCRAENMFAWKIIFESSINFRIPCMSAYISYKICPLGLLFDKNRQARIIKSVNQTSHKRLDWKYELSLLLYCYMQTLHNFYLDQGILLRFKCKCNRFSNYIYFILFYILENAVIESDIIYSVFYFRYIISRKLSKDLHC